MKTKYKLNQKPHQNKIPEKFLQEILTFTFLEHLCLFQNVSIKWKKRFITPKNTRNMWKIVLLKRRKQKAQKNFFVVLSVKLCLIQCKLVDYYMCQKVKFLVWVSLP